MESRELMDWKKLFHDLIQVGRSKRMTRFHKWHMKNADHLAVDLVNANIRDVWGYIEEFAEEEGVAFAVIVLTWKKIGSYQYGVNMYSEPQKIISSGSVPFLNMLDLRHWCAEQFFGE